MNFSRKTKFLFLCALVVLLISGVVFWRYKTSYPKYKIVRFSSTQYLVQRQKIAELIVKELDSPSPFLKVSPSEIDIAPVDLNDDGINEWIVLVKANGFGGAGGIATYVYACDKGKFRPLWVWNLTAGELAILDHKTNGYRDIMSFVIGCTFKEEDDRKHTLAFIKPEGYDYVKTQMVTEYERRLFENEEL